MNAFHQQGFVPQETYSPGDTVAVSGLYDTLHSIAHPVYLQPLKKGSRFPLCSTCGVNVTYLLIQSAPDVDSDEDFQSAAEQV